MEVKTVEPIFTKENMFDHSVIIIRWVNSCDTSEQIKLLTLFINNTFIPGYEKAIEEEKDDTTKKAFKYDLELHKTDFTEAIDSRKAVIAGNRTKNKAQP